MTLLFGACSVNDVRFDVLIAISIKNIFFGGPLQIEAADSSEMLVPIYRTYVASCPWHLLLMVVVIMYCV